MDFKYRMNDGILISYVLGDIKLDSETLEWSIIVMTILG